MLTNLELLYDRIETDYYDMREEWSEYEFEDLMCEVADIAKYKSMFNYIMEHKPFDEEQAEHFLKMENPFRFICSRYNPIESEVHEEYKTVIDDIFDHKITDMQDTPCFAELKWQMFHEKEKYEGKLGAHIDKNALRNVNYNLFIENYRFDEYQSRVLMQFKEPLLVLVKEIGSTDEPFEKQIERVMENLGSVDLLTYQHELNKGTILPETRQRHDAIIELMDIVPEFHFQTAMEWLLLNRYLNRSMLEGDGEDNPYQDFLNTMRDIKETHGAEVLQKVFDIGTDVVMQNSELVEVAKYIADDKEIDRIPDLLDDDYFLVPYEEHKQGGMNLC